MQGPLCGALATMLLYGITCVQQFHYHQNYKSDSWVLKVVVRLITETVETGLSVYFLEHYLITNFANENALYDVVWSVPASFALGFVTAYLANLCFIWRIWRLSRHLVVSLLLTILATARLILGLVNSFLAINSASWDAFAKTAYVPIAFSWFLSIGVDALIAFMMYRTLYKQRTGLSDTDSMINRLLLYAVNTGAVTSLGAVLVLILFFALPHSLAFLGPLQVQERMYSVSLLASLNSRRATLSLSLPRGETFQLTSVDPDIDFEPPTKTMQDVADGERAGGGARARDAAGTGEQQTRSRVAFPDLELGGCDSSESQSQYRGNDSESV
ncbi:hypothetical protein CONPUDRAFT_91317 [Coniophora puteana RWD-64-598 SS2]|uniref:DUF6534 domain-containing protein n=1 Tax=Coniophora puteana (strain RWD-64-598) TaxID=741705 RepID=A0A5M3MIB5_CONPW|nr:uncharacterized protein CONPUDRAFT_91317 [Coniophora puteana RWD-64-598 SS2]EIW78952.1 hypothetical protein CONPUDRAFT_91317 [Coniophora puteana RWD-64-598 SS2]